MSVQQSTVDIDEFTIDWHLWHQQQEARLADPHGFLAITNLHWLSGQPQRFAGCSGHLVDRLRRRDRRPR